MARSVSLDYEPDGEVLRRFHLCDDFVRILIGPFASAKTTACCMEIYRRAHAQAADDLGVRKTRWLVIRSTYPELESTSIKSWRDIFGEEFGRMTWGHPPVHNMRFRRRDDNTIVECEVMFMALDGPDAEEKIRGMNLTGGWANEIREIEKPIIDVFTSRFGRYPPPHDGGPTWSGMIGDTNAPDEEHYLYRFAEEEPQEGWTFFKQPPAVFKVGDKWVVNQEAENLRILKKMEKRFYERLIAGKSEDWIRVNLANEYGFVREGKSVYPEYVDSEHCREFEWDQRFPIHIGADFGLTPAAVLAQQGLNGQIRWGMELVTEDVGADSFGDALVEILNRDFQDFEIGTMTGDPAGIERAPTDKETVYNVLHAKGLPFELASTNRFSPRREAVALPLSKLIDGEPGLIIHPRCIVLRKGMSGRYHRRRLRIKDEEIYTDRPVKNRYSHICEAGQYCNLGLGQGELLLRRKPRGPRHKVNPPLQQLENPDEAMRDF